MLEDGIAKTKVTVGEQRLDAKGHGFDEGLGKPAALPILAALRNWADADLDARPVTTGR